MADLNDSFLRVLHEGLTVWEIQGLVALGSQLESNDAQETHFININMTVEVNAPNEHQASQDVADFIKAHVPWDAWYRLTPVYKPAEGWDSA